VECIETDVSKLTMADDGILYWDYHPGADVSFAEAKKEMKEVGKLVTQNAAGKRPFLIDIRKIHRITLEARSHFASTESSQYVRAAALVTESAISRVIGNFFLGLNKPPHPIKIFTSEEKALNWLQAQNE